MEFLTKLVGRPVLDVDGERVGRLTEIVVTPSDLVPMVAAYQVKTEDGAMFVPADALAVKSGSRTFSLNRAIHNILPYQIKPHDFSLVRDVLDKQIVDVHDYRVVRVNDIGLEPLRDGKLALLGVDPGFRGILRRLGLEEAIDSLARLFHRNPPDHFIAWNDVESLPTHNAGEPLKLKVSHTKLAKLHPADIGDILNQMDLTHRKEVLDSLDVETAADALAEADDDVQVETLKHLDEERAADILEEMPADEAADVLGDLDAISREDLLSRMDEEEREDVRELLPYGDETAGGLMTNEMVSISENYTAAQIIETLRELKPSAESGYYVYVVDKDERLVGVISLRDLIIAEPQTVVSEFMLPSVRTISIDASIEEVAHTFERYKLLALPVIDSERRLEGIITIDDTLEQLLPDDWRRRPFHRRSNLVHD